MFEAAEIAPIARTCPPAGADGEHITFCRLCEAACGMVATVRDGRVVAMAPDRLNPHSQGHVCVKGMAFHEMAHDPDRVTRPLKRLDGSDQFVPVEWDEALDEIARRLGAIHAEDGGDAIAFYIGNPTSFATDTVMTHSGFMKALGSRKGYSPGSQDSNARTVANFALFGSAMANSFPDLPHCDFLMIFGANPLVSNGSILFAPRVRHDLDAIAARGRVVVVDPRASETARRYEHLQLRPGTDIWLILGMIATLFAEGRVDRDAVGKRALGLDRLADAMATIDIARAAQECGITETALRQLARDFHAVPRAAAYSRVGLCRGAFSTLSNAMITILNVIAGKFGGTRGGTIFGYPLLAGSELGHYGGYGEGTSRIGGIPTVARYTASAAMPDDILEPGEGRVRAMFMTAGNPMLSAPGGGRLEQALEALDLFVAFDFYVNETSRYADFVLPATTWLERSDFPYGGFNVLMRPFVQWTDAVIEPVGHARHEHHVYREIVRRMGIEWPNRPGASTDGTPMDRIDHQLRTGPAGDRFGENPSGWSAGRLALHRHGVMVDLPDPTEQWWMRLGHPDRKIHLWHPIIANEFDRFQREYEPPPRLSLIGRRDIRSINSWMHNVDRLVRSQQPILLVHDDDASAFDLSDGELARLWTDHGEIEVEISISDDVAPGTVCYPHGWGHRGGWSRANATPGKNINILLGLGIDAVEFVSGTTIMDGISVNIAPVRRAEA